MADSDYMLDSVCSRHYEALFLATPPILGTPTCADYESMFNVLGDDSL